MVVSPSREAGKGRGEHVREHNDRVRVATGNGEFMNSIFCDLPYLWDGLLSRGMIKSSGLLVVHVHDHASSLHQKEDELQAFASAVIFARCHRLHSARPFHGSPEK